MQRKLRWAACLAAGALWACGATTARAQDANRDTVMTKADVGDIVERLGSKTGEFKAQFDQAVSHSLIDGTRLEDRAKRRADDLHDSARNCVMFFTTSATRTIRPCGTRRTGRWPPVRT